MLGFLKKVSEWKKNFHEVRLYHHIDLYNTWTYVIFYLKLET